MIWTTWRLNRAAWLMVLAIVIGLMAFLIPTGLQKLALFRDSGLEAYLAAGGADFQSSLVQNFISTYRTLNITVNFLVLLPAIAGALLVTSIIGEFELRTHRLAWTQSITRRRWLVIRIAAALLGAVAFSLALSALITWWYQPLSQLEHPFTRLFGLRGIVPVAYTIFALAVALLLGTLSRKTAVSIVGTILIFFISVFAVSDWARPHYMTPIETITPASQALNGLRLTPGTEGLPVAGTNWKIDFYPIDAAGNRLTEDEFQVITSGSPSRDALGAYLDGLGIRMVEKYQPADRFWTFQMIESGIFIGAAIPLLGATAWVVGRRMR